MNVSPRVFDSGLGVSIFRDNSTRTRFSFASACDLLGLAVSDLDEKKSQIAHGETVRETAAMISFLTEAVGIRDDMYLGAGNAYMREFASAMERAYRDGVLPGRPTLVNLQCDIDHPTQAMADLLHLVNTVGGIDALKGKRIAMTWAYSPSYGKPLSVPQGIIGLFTRFGMDVVLAHPEGYTLIPEVEEIAAKNAASSGGSYRRVGSMEEAFRGRISSIRRAGPRTRSCRGAPSFSPPGTPKGSSNWKNNALPTTAASCPGRPRRRRCDSRGTPCTCTAFPRTSRA